MAHSNISIFVPHAGCPYRCSFCDQNTISGENELPHGEDVRRICRQAMAEIKNLKDTEIAFFGGSFTAIDREYMTELLEAAHPFVGEGGFKGIRLSTRPDCINEEILRLLKSYGVTAIELGAQSLDDKVLAANDRGHSAEDVFNSSRLIREWGFELGLQLMVGLYGSCEEIELDNMSKVLDIRPDTVRIYPVVILKRTRLAGLLGSGKYRPMPFEKVVKLCSKMLCEFEQAGIRVIKCGLHASEFVEQDMVGGYYHPAFRELCESELYRESISNALLAEGIPLYPGGNINVVCAVAKGCVSRAVGHKRSNADYFRQHGVNIKFIADDAVQKYQCVIRR